MCIIFSPQPRWWSLALFACFSSTEIYETHLRMARAFLIFRYQDVCGSKVKTSQPKAISMRLWSQIKCRSFFAKKNCDSQPSDILFIFLFSSMDIQKNIINLHQFTARFSSTFLAMTGMTIGQSEPFRISFLDTTLIIRRTNFHEPTDSET